MNKTKLITSSAYAAITSIVFVVVITIWAEFNAPLKNWLANFSGHHWTSKSIFSVVLYALVTFAAYLLPFKYSDDCLKKSLNFLFAFTVLGVAALALFFTGHHFKIF
ncbi:MAG: hypothetical protein A2534_00990 [Candidatus Magasanikbacteria bacterium RIFOXYD2_FULL_39_9]|uniref:Uncharacterized protein n=1 Tax=Candidatus Magasanikbacteria bacterium RIFOXYD1_FULL_40_23 TaxID=1798705 RepID=A0A1F6P8M8_9BACT|nr:MAG: hypothetical protein A2563_02445 [Candidatus Magasanikbacteria bacterium RIFOXYD1_FULL_40_23]OGH93161.1 MAG: hypothetical protein A2534_00990 [Candidatus Magasanikbacteria bacterium RIFOXYD2_FULL_39_9]